jgi:hypothetical protein
MVAKISIMTICAISAEPLRNDIVALNPKKVTDLFKK